MAKLFIVLFIFVLAGCSNQTIYDTLQSNKRDKCMQAPQPDYAECLERTDKSYKAYAHEREKISKP